MNNAVALEPFTGNARFEVVRRLGAGGMGVVYLALDRERGKHVAIKTLGTIEAGSIAGLKREFRALADIEHPNLVALDELFFEDGRWFFSMEFVEAIPFDEYVRGGSSVPFDSGVRERLPSSEVETAAEQATPARSDELPTRPRNAGPSSDGGDTFASRIAATERLVCRADVPRLRSALKQLASAVHALHRAGKLHRDLKPSNVLVTPAGRVVVLDFGIARDLHASAGTSRAPDFAGTPLYMAPEQAMRAETGPASDWYAVGVMLFEALVGRCPFVGNNANEILFAKHLDDAPRVEGLVDGAPPDLARLCDALLQRDDKSRPNGDTVLAVARGEASADTISLSLHALADAASGIETPFTGRDIELRALRDAFATSRAGRAVTVYLHGPSGFGKSTLVERSCAEASAAGALVLRGRCYERETVPFKAFDALVDALAAHLRGLTANGGEAMFPHGVRELAVLFPVLLDVPEIAAQPLEDAPDQGAQRRLAFTALRQLLGALASRVPVVAHLDDLHWSDADSARLFTALVAAPDPPPVLWVGSFRTEEGAASEALATFRNAQGNEADVREIALGPLSGDALADLSRTLLGANANATVVSRVAAESAGSPLFLAELAQHVVAGGALRTPTLEAALMARVAALPDPARALLEIVAVAGEPIPQGVAIDASNTRDDRLRAISALRAGRLLRTRGPRATDLVEAYHDRVRETVYASLETGRRVALHRQFADTLEQSSAPDASLLARHLAAAGEFTRARRYALLAARNAAAALAFEQSAEFYRRALAWTDGVRPEEERATLAALGEVLVLCGRAAEAAPVYARAASLASGTIAQEMLRRAAEQYLKSGHVDEGVDTLRNALAPVGVRYPESPTTAMALLVGRILRLRARGTKFVERRESDVPPGDLARVDACAAAGKGLMLIDPVRGYGYLTSFLLHALAAGEPKRVASGLALNAVNLARTGESGYRRAKEWIALTEKAAERFDDTYLRGLAAACDAGVTVCTARWRDCTAASAKALPLLRASRADAGWEIMAASALGRTGMVFLGDMARLREVQREQLREARELGNRFGEAYARVHGWSVWLAEDDVDGGLRDLDDAVKSWSQRGFHAIHFWGVYGSMQHDLYRGRPEEALARWAAVEEPVKASRILSMQFYRVFSRMARAACHLAAARDSRSKRGSHLGAAAVLAKELRSEKNAGYAHAGAALIDAGSARVRGDEAGALAWASKAARGFEEADMALYAASVRRALGTLVGGDSGHTLVESADGALAKLGVEAPARWAGMYAAGF